MEKTARKIPRAWEKTGYRTGNVFPPQGYDVDAALGVKDEIRVPEQKLRGYTWATRQYSFLGMFLSERIGEVFGRFRGVVSAGEEFTPALVHTPLQLAALCLLLPGWWRKRWEVGGIGRDVRIDVLSSLGRESLHSALLSHTSSVKYCKRHAFDRQSECSS